MTEQKRSQTDTNKDADKAQKKRGLRRLFPGRRRRRPTRPHRRRVLGLLVLILIVLALAGILGSAWLWFMGSPQTHRLNHRLAHLQQQVHRNSGQLSQQGNALDKVNSLAGKQHDLSRQLQHQSNDLNALDQKMDSVQKGLGKINNLLRGGHQVWQLNAVEELLLTANDRLALRGDVSGALQAFRIAQRRLGRIADPRLIHVRKLLSDQTAALESLPRLDVAGMALRLSSLASRVDKLPLGAQVPKNYQDGRTTTEPVGKHWWQRLADSITDTLAGVVRIRRTGKPPKVLLPPDRAYFLYQNLELKLESTRVALLRRQDKVFHDSLENALQWLQIYFKTDASGVQAMTESLQRMQGKNLQPNLPQTGKALAALRKDLRNRQGARQELQPAGSGNGHKAHGS